MNIILLWSSFIVTISALNELSQLSYLLCGIAIFFATYAQNKYKPSRISFRQGLLIFNVPIFIIWYLLFVYNDFLSINPMSYELLFSSWFLYIYLILYLYIEFPKN